MLGTVIAGGVVAQLLLAAAVFLCGAGVGASELVARYKDAPFRALRTVAAGWYIAVNAVAAAFAYLLIVEFDFFAGTPHKEWVEFLVAVFGSMAFFRSSLFTMKVGETDVAVGPGIFFQVLLYATDRACDRGRAEPRSALASSIMRGVSFELARDALPSFCFELMQNVPAGEQQQFRQVVDALSSSKMLDSIKTMNLGLMLMNVVGSQVLAAAVSALGEKIQGPAKLDLDVFSRLQNADFDKAFPLLVDACFIMSRFGTDQAQAEAKKAVIAETSPLADQPAVDNGTKMTLLGLSLQQRVGDAVLLAALMQFADGIRPRAAAGAGADGGGAQPGAAESAEIVALHPDPARPPPQDNPGTAN